MPQQLEILRREGGHLEHKTLALLKTKRMTPAFNQFRAETENRVWFYTDKALFRSLLSEESSTALYVNGHGRLGRGCWETRLSACRVVTWPS